MEQSFKMSRAWLAQRIAYTRRQGRLGPKSMRVWYCGQLSVLRDISYRAQVQRKLERGRVE